MQSFELILEDGKWLNPPANYNINETSIVLQTEPCTDFWQRSYYGFQSDNAPAYLFESDKNFTFTVKADFTYKKLFDQCGIVIYLDTENWFKASIEYENDEFSRLGSVVTNNGYSDWATTDISHVSTIWYRLSRRGPDFLVESSMDGIIFRQMRVFHLHSLGTTTPEMGVANPPLPASKSVAFGVYACSPVDSSFNIEFSEVSFIPCIWKAHSVD